MSLDHAASLLVSAACPNELCLVGILIRESGTLAAPQRVGNGATDISHRDRRDHEVRFCCSRGRVGRETPGPHAPRWLVVAWLTRPTLV
jgi:hypothetical protein